MKVKDLIAELQKLDGEMQCIMQKDREGNGYGPLEGLDAECIYVVNWREDGEVFGANDTNDEADMEPEDWAEVLQLPRCVVLYPTN
jgi:hypothetical protein